MVAFLLWSTKYTFPSSVKLDSSPVGKHSGCGTPSFEVGVFVDLGC